MKRTLTLSFVLISIFLSAQIGVNISLPERGGTYIDLVKENYRWNNLSNNNSLTSNEVDSKGWPMVDCRYIIDFRPVAEWINQIDDPNVYRLDVSGSWTCSFSGSANVDGNVGGNVQNLNYNAQTNLTTFDFVVSPGSNGFMLIDFSNTRRHANSPANSGISNFKMLRPGYANDDALFHTPLLDIFDQVKFESIRYMPFTGTNGMDPDFPMELEWVDRKLPDDASQRSIGPINKNGGGCWEHVIRLANTTMTDPWINVPASASANYVFLLANLFKDNLDPSLKLYVENSNEVWNTAPGFEQTEYSRLQAMSLGIDERENYARRTVELAQIFDMVYGPGSLNDKVRVVLCSHKPMLKWWVQPMMDYVTATFGPPSDYIYSIASQTYFSGGHDIGEDTTKILEDCHESITAQFNEVAGNEAGRVQWIAKAREWKLRGGYSSYEGGPDHGGGSTDNIDNRIQAERSFGMCEEMRYNLQDGFIDLGGMLAMQFTLTSSYNRYGCWGLTDNINQPFRNHKMACIQDLIKGGTTNINNVNPTSYQLTTIPNPFSDQIEFKFLLKENGKIKLSIYNSHGQLTDQTAYQPFSAGENKIQWLSQNHGSGVYYYQLMIGHDIVHGKILKQ